MGSIRSVHSYLLGCFLFRLCQMTLVLFTLVHNHTDNPVLLNVNFHPLFFRTLVYRNTLTTALTTVLLLCNRFTVRINRF